MFTENNKVYFEASDFEYAVEEISTIIDKENIIHGNNSHIITPYRGGLPLGVRLSNQCNTPLSILDYQRLDGNNENKTVSFMKNNNISVSETLFLVDDIADHGITINKCLAFLNNQFPNNRIIVYTIYGNNQNHNPSWKYTYKHTGEWVVFLPWEGK